ncbi:MAG: hypothetical protein IIA72_18580 [Proteobacteria bacterium]|nr:hypothetical protein [Pseudomonadota bacterium]
MPKRPYPRWQRRHEAVLLWLLENPPKKLKDCAAATGYSRTHISRIINSPDFRARYEAAVDAGRAEAYRRYFARLTECRR